MLTDSTFDEKANSSSVSLPDGGRQAQPAWTGDRELIEKINLYFASDVVPNVRKFLAEPDKVLALCSSIVSGAVSPALKSRQRYHALASLRLELITNMGMIDLWTSTRLCCLS